jgi:hypothetical protein
MVWISRAPIDTSEDPYFASALLNRKFLLVQKISLEFLGMEIFTLENNTWKPLFPHVMVRDPASTNRMLRLVPKNLRKAAGAPASGDAFCSKPRTT